MHSVSRLSMKALLTLGRVPSRRGKPKNAGGYKIYLTTQDRGQWVEFGGGGRRKVPNGLPAQKRSGRESAEAAWKWVEENLLGNDDLVNAPERFHDLWPYEPHAPHMAEIFWETQRPLNYYVATREPNDEAADAAETISALSSLFDESRDIKKYQRLQRPNQAQFRRSVFGRYGRRCSFCRIDDEALLDAAHLVAWMAKGVDAPENGLILCKLHHCAMDKGLIRIDPTTLELRSRDGGGTLSDLHVEVEHIRHLPEAPDVRALRWLWEQQE
jgi:hypothetical protein